MFLTLSLWGILCYYWNMCECRKPGLFALHMLTLLFVASCGRIGFELLDQDLGAVDADTDADSDDGTDSDADTDADTDTDTDADTEDRKSVV